MARASGSRDFDKKKPRLKRALEAGLAREQERRSVEPSSNHVQTAVRRRPDFRHWNLKKWRSLSGVP
jgi:hypothetical protein